MKQFQGRVICPGTCEAEALVSHGGFNTLASYQKAMKIHDKQVEWNSTIKTDDPQQVVNEVADTMDQLVAAAIQQALLGSTDKMATRF